MVKGANGSGYSSQHDKKSKAEYHKHYHIINKERIRRQRLRLAEQKKRDAIFIANQEQL